MEISITYSPLHISHKSSRVVCSFDQSINAVIPVLLSSLGLMFLGTKENPFSTNPNTMRAALATFLIYFLFSSRQLIIRTRLFHFSPAAINKHCKMFSGNAAVVLLGSILFPDSVRPLLYVIFLVLSARESRCWLYKKVVKVAGGFCYGIRRHANSLRSPRAAQIQTV